MLVPLVAGLVLGACASHVPVERDNTPLRRAIFEATPESWRSAVDVISPASPLLVDPALREFIRSSIRSNATQRDQILALTNLIIDADGIGLTYDPDATHTASEAFRSRKGNCLGFSNLLVASARDLGLNANFELVSHALRWEKVGGALVGTLHIRVVSYTAGAKMVFDFYPLPIESGYSTQPLSDNDALAHYLNNLAMTSMQEGDDATAFALLFDAIETSPNIGFIWSNLGVLLSRNELNLLAREAFEEALLISPDTLSALSNLQRLHIEEGRETEAEALMAELEEHRSRNPYFHFWNADEAYGRGDYEEAVGHLKKAIDLKKNESEFYLLLSKSYENLGLRKAALRASRRAKSASEPPQTTPYSVRRPPPKTGTRITRK